MWFTIAIHSGQTGWYILQKYDVLRKTLDHIKTFFDQEPDKETIVEYHH